MKSTIAANKYLNSIEPRLTIYKGDGYFYFQIPEIGCTPTSIYTYSIKDLCTEDLDYAIAEFKQSIIDGYIIH
jgi:hypothetical protein